MLYLINLFNLDTLPQSFSHEDVLTWDAAVRANVSQVDGAELLFLADHALTITAAFPRAVENACLTAKGKCHNVRHSRSSSVFLKGAAVDLVKEKTIRVAKDGLTSIRVRVSGVDGKVTLENVSSDKATIGFDKPVIEQALSCLIHSNLTTLVGSVSKEVWINNLREWLSSYGREWLSSYSTAIDWYNDTPIAWVVQQRACNVLVSLQRHFPRGYFNECCSILAIGSQLEHNTAITTAYERGLLKKHDGQEAAKVISNQPIQGKIQFAVKPIPLAMIDNKQEEPIEPGRDNGFLPFDIDTPMPGELLEEPPQGALPAMESINCIGFDIDDLPSINNDSFKDSK